MDLTILYTLYATQFIVGISGLNIDQPEGEGYFTQWGGMEYTAYFTAPDAEVKLFILPLVGVVTNHHRVLEFSGRKLLSRPLTTDHPLNSRSPTP